MKGIKLMKLSAIGVILIAMTMGQAAPDGCEGAQRTGARADMQRQVAISDQMQDAQKTPTDIRFSLERYNLIRRAYWVNGMREKALSMPCKVNKPIGYIVLVTGNGSILGAFIVDGKLSSLKSYLTPISEAYETVYGGGSRYVNNWLSDVDGCYGDNDDGVFFFTPDGKYIEWKGAYLYSDIPFTVKDPVLKLGVEGGLK